MNNEIEIHPIPNGFIPKNAEVLIVGTFPPKREYESKGSDFFFYSSVRNHFWNRIDNIFPDCTGLKKTKSKNNTESFSENKNRKKNFALEKKLGFLDIFTKIRRRNDTSNDSDLVSVENILENNKLLTFIDSTSNLKRICCTYELAYEILRNSINDYTQKFQIVEEKSSANNEKIEIIIYGKKIEIVLLFPATRSMHKGAVKDQQYKKYLFS